MGSEMKIYSGKFPALRQIDVAIIGLGNNANLVRKELYKYSYNFSGIQVADFGNLNHNGSARHINAGLAECLIALKAENIIPLLIGDTTDYSAGLFNGNTFTQVDYALVSPLVAMQPGNMAYRLKTKKKLFHASFIAQQNFLNTFETIQNCSEVFTEHIRLGDLRANPSRVEPLLRQADIFEFNLSAIRHADFGSGALQLPNGLMNHEACSVCRYAGISNNISLYLLDGFTLGDSVTDAMQAAQMAWYILDGIDNRFNDHPAFNHRNFTFYKCHAHSGEDMLFVTSELTGRWWMQMPSLARNKKAAVRYIGCEESDFEIAKQGEVPEKWYRAVGIES